MMQGTIRVSTTVTINIAQHPHKHFVPLVEATTFGSDGLQYQRLSVQSQLDRFCEPVFFHAIAKDKLVGVYVLDKRNLLINGIPVRGYYRGILVVEPSFQGNGVGRSLTKAALAWLAEEAKTQPVVSYGCIDSSNKRSMNLLQSTGASIGTTLSMYMMYRQWPSINCKLDSMHTSHASSVHSLKQDLHKDYQVRDVSDSRLPGLVLQDANGVAICARVSTTSFRISNMGRMAAISTRLFVKPFSAARKRFDPDCFRYVSFSDVLIRPGCEKLWPRFVSTALARYECHFGAVYVNTHCRLFTQMQKAQPFARLLHSSTGSINVVWQTFDNVNGKHIALPENTANFHIWPVDA